MTMRMLFDRSDRFLRSFDALCAVLFAAVFWQTHSWVWAVSGAISAALCVTNASVHLQAMVHRAIRGFALAALLKKGGV